MAPYYRNCSLIKWRFPFSRFKIVFNYNLAVYSLALSSYTGIMISIKAGM